MRDGLKKENVSTQIGREVDWQSHMGEAVDFMRPKSSRYNWEAGVIYKVIKKHAKVERVVIIDSRRKKISIPISQANELILFQQKHIIMKSRFTIAELQQLPLFTRVRLIRNAFKYGGDLFWENTKAVAHMMYGYPNKDLLVSMDLLLRAAGLPEIFVEDRNLINKFVGEFDELIIRVQKDIKQ